jgi:hypothetical protein
MTFQRGFSVFIAHFSSKSLLPARIIEIKSAARLVMVISVVPLPITQSMIKECIERQLDRAVIMTILGR